MNKIKGCQRFLEETSVYKLWNFLANSTIFRIRIPFILMHFKIKQALNKKKYQAASIHIFVFPRILFAKKIYQYKIPMKDISWFWRIFFPSKYVLYMEIKRSFDSFCRLMLLRNWYHHMPLSRLVQLLRKYSPFIGTKSKFKYFIFSAIFIRIVASKQYTQFGL